MGGGYSFETLRAKLLFAQGAFKIQKAKPKFERRRETILEGKTLAMYGLPFSDAPPEAINCGPSSSTLVQLIEEGKI